MMLGRLLPSRHPPAELAAEHAEFIVRSACNRAVLVRPTNEIGHLQLGARKQCQTGKSSMYRGKRRPRNT
jgi:hypothetical protein